MDRLHKELLNGIAERAVGYAIFYAIALSPFLLFGAGFALGAWLL